MPRIIVQTDDGVTVDTHDFPEGSVYATYMIPGCPAHTGVHDMLNWLRYTLDIAGYVQEHGTLPPERPSEKVMRILAERKEKNK